MTKKELEEQLMKMPELEQEMENGKSLEKALVEQLKGEREFNPKMKMTDAQIKDMVADIEHTRIEEGLDHKGEKSKWQTTTTLEQEEDELIHKRMNDINTFQAHENEVYLRGTDEYGKDFQICFDSYNFLEWIDTEHLKYIKKQLIKYIKTK